METRYFEYKDKTSSKFWEITLSCNMNNTMYTVTTKWGAMYTSGTSKNILTSAGKNVAEALIKKKIAEKINKGYKEKTSSSVQKVDVKPAVPAPTQWDIY